MSSRIFQGVLFFVGLLALAVLFLPASVWVRISDNESADPFSSFVLLTLFVVLSAALIVAALLLAYGLRLWGSGEGDGRFTAVIFLTLGVLILAKGAHSTYQVTLWDNTTDPLGFLCLGAPFLALLFVTIVLLLALPGKMKLVGLLFVLVVPLLLMVVSGYGQDVDMVALTEGRADVISGALEAYYEDNGRYPQKLNQLRPRYLLSVPEQGIIFAQDWCYEGGEEGYALGYVMRDHWSDPRLYGRVEAVGEWIGVPGNEVCAAEIAGLMARGVGYYEVRGDAPVELDRKR